MKKNILLRKKYTSKEENSYEIYYFIIALAEAKDITLYLNPLKRPIQQLEEIDFAECKPLLIPLMYVICTMWGNSRYYSNSSKITVLLKQLCNLIIQQVSSKRYSISVLYLNLEFWDSKITILQIGIIPFLKEPNLV